MKVEVLFYEPIKIYEEDKNVLFWGCTHYGHNPNWPIPIWKTRKYESFKAHDAGIIANWNSKANDSTIGFLLGDILFGNNGEARLIMMLNELKFKELYICSGNHQAGFKQLLKKAIWLDDEGKLCSPFFKLGEKKIYFLPNYFELYVNGIAVVASHYPILSWNSMAKGSIHLFSHVHGSLVKTDLGRLYLEKARAVEVSIEENTFPLDFTEIKGKVQNKDAFAPDHHTRETANGF